MDAHAPDKLAGIGMDVNAALCRRHVQLYDDHLAFEELFSAPSDCAKAHGAASSRHNVAAAVCMQILGGDECRITYPIGTSVQSRSVADRCSGGA